MVGDLPGVNPNAKYNDDWYTSIIEKYKSNPEMYNRLQNNPFLVSNNSGFTPSLLQKLAESFGDTSAREGYYQNLRSSANQWLSDEIAKFDQTNYDNPVNQAERLRAAGQNPDLTGGLSPGSMAENDQPISPIGFPQGSDIGEVFNLGSTFLSSTFSVLNGLQGIKSAILDNDLKEITLGSNFGSFADEVIKSGIAEFESGFDFSPGSSRTVEDIMRDGKFYDALATSFSDRVANLPISNRLKRKFRKVFEDRLYYKDSDGVSHFTASYEKLVKDTLSDLMKSRNNYSQSYALPGSSEQSNFALKFISNEIYKPLTDIQLQVQKALLQNEHNYWYDSEGNVKDIGSSRFSADKAEFDYKSSMGDIRNRIMSAFQAINKKITGSRDLSPTWKIALQAGVASMEAFSLSKLNL